MMRTYRASALGGCMKAQIAEKLEYTALDVQKKMENMSREGQLHEDAVIERLIKEGAVIEDRQKEVVLRLLNDVEVVGHLDGKDHDGDIVEVKSMSPDAFRNWKKYGWDAKGFVQKYKWQVSIYMLAENAEMKFCVKNRSSGELDIVVVSHPFYTKDEILSRILEIEKWVRRGELPDECDVQNFPCPFYYLEQEIEVHLTDDEELEAAAFAYENARKEKQDAESALKEARKHLDEVLGNREKVTTKKVKVTYYEQSRKILDREKMEGDGIDVEKYERPQISKYLRVTIRKERKEDDASNESGGDAGGTTPDRQHLHESGNDESSPDVH